MLKYVIDNGFQLVSHGQELRDQVYDFMCKEANKPGNYAYYEYIQEKVKQGEKS